VDEVSAVPLLELLACDDVEDLARHVLAGGPQFHHRELQVVTAQVLDDGVGHGVKFGLGPRVVVTGEEDDRLLGILSSRLLFSRELLHEVIEPPDLTRNVHLRQAEGVDEGHDDVDRDAEEQPASVLVTEPGEEYGEEEQRDDGDPFQGSHQSPPR